MGTSSMVQLAIASEYGRQEKLTAWFEVSSSVNQCTEAQSAAKSRKQAPERTKVLEPGTCYPEGRKQVIAAAAADGTWATTASAGRSLAENTAIVSTIVA